jgi:hypothetical protein
MPKVAYLDAVLQCVEGSVIECLDGEDVAKCFPDIWVFATMSKCGCEWRVWTDVGVVSRTACRRSLQPNGYAPP